MNTEQYLLLKLAEECNEVAQMAMKCMQFGLDDEYQGESNRERLHKEIDDLHASKEMLNVNTPLQYIYNMNNVEAKKKKVLKYFKLSQELGMVGKEEVLKV